MILWRERAKLDPPDMEPHTALRVRDEDPDIEYVSFLVKDYKVRWVQAITFTLHVLTLHAILVVVVAAAVVAVVEAVVIAVAHTRTILEETHVKESLTPPAQPRRFSFFF